MASIYREFIVEVPLAFAWQAAKDFGNAHNVLAKGVVTNTILEDNVRTVTFANGMQGSEILVAIDEDHHRLVYSATSERVEHHNAAMQLFGGDNNTTRIVWITDVLPDSLQDQLAPMVDECIKAVIQTLQDNYRQEK